MSLNSLPAGQSRALPWALVVVLATLGLSGARHLVLAVQAYWMCKGTWYATLAVAHHEHAHCPPQIQEWFVSLISISYAMLALLEFYAYLARRFKSKRKNQPNVTKPSSR